MDMLHGPQEKDLVFSGIEEFLEQGVQQVRAVS